MFREVADLYHDLDDGMRPISVIFPYLPTAFHRRRDAARTQLHAIFSKVIAARRASGVKEDDMLQVGAGVGGGVGWVGVGVGQAWPGLAFWNFVFVADPHALDASPLNPSFLN